MTDNSSANSNNVSEFNRFLNNNTTFIFEKFNQIFLEPFPITELQTEVHLEGCLKFIYDIFSFHKYQSNPKLNQTLRKGLTENLQNFIKEVKKKTGSQSEFNKQESINLLKYCIENNDMFAVHYDKKNPKKKNQHKQPEKVQQNPPNQQQKPSQNNLSQPPQIQDPQQQVQPQSQETYQKQDIRQSHINDNTQIAPFQPHCSNQFENAIPVRPISQNMDLIRKQLKTIFEFYCKQQPNLTPNSTFDSINHKCKTMNIGKFIFFSVASNIVQSKEKAYSQARLDKKSAMAIFKRFAQGKQEIEFKVFLSIMEQFHKNDESIYIKMGLGEDNNKGKNNLISNYKNFNLPFYTRDPEGRQKSPAGRPFVPKLTTHSGKIEQSLREQLISRRERPIYQSKQKLMAQAKTIFRSKGQAKAMPLNSEDLRQSSKFTLRLGESGEENDGENLKFLSKLITHQQNDEIFLKEYHLPLRKSNNQNKQRSMNASYDEPGRYTKMQQQIAERQFGKTPGDLTSRQPKQSLILPLIKQKKTQGLLLSQRRSMNSEKKTGSKF